MGRFGTAPANYVLIRIFHFAVNYFHYPLAFNVSRCVPLRHQTHSTMSNAVNTPEYLTITINRSEKKTIFLGHGAPTSFRQRKRIKSAIRQAWFARPLIGAWEVSFMVGNEAVVITDNKVVRQTYTTRATYNRTLNVSLS